MYDVRTRISTIVLRNKERPPRNEDVNLVVTRVGRVAGAINSCMHCCVSRRVSRVAGRSS